MKKKLLAVVLSVVMIAALFVPMMAISAAAPSAKLGLGNATIQTLKGVDYVVIPVMISENDAELVGLVYQVVSKEGLKPFNFNGKNSDFKTEFEDDFGGTVTVTFDATCVPGTYTDRLQVLHACSEDLYGVSAKEGCIGYAYFVAPTDVGTYTFELVYDNSSQYIRDDLGTASAAEFVFTVVNTTATYTVECKNHIAGTPEVTKEATCTEDGEEVTKCTACGATMDTETIDALGHDWDNGTVADNVKCGDTADTVYKCEREGCDETKTETGAVVQHDMVADEENSKAPTCTEAGVEATKCAREGCDHTEEKTIAELGHNMESDQAAGSAPTCTEDGKVVEKCTREGCDHTEETTIDALGHDMVADEENSKDATCYAEGVEATKCNREGCDHTVQTPIEKQPHNFSGDVNVVTAPTAEAEGKYTIDCANEGCTEYEEHTAKKLDTVVEHKDEDGKVIIGFKTENAVLPEDILPVVVNGPVKDEATGKISETITFGSVLVDDLSGEVEFSINSLGMITNPVVTAKDAEGNTVVVESTFENGVLTFKADLAGEYILTYEEVKTSPDTSDASNTVVFAVVALIAVAGLVVVGKKRFAL